MSITPILAHGLGGLLTMFEGATVATLIVIGALVLCVVVWAFRDLFRFGRDGFPWVVPVGVAALFGGFGFWIVGYVGVSIAVPILVAFGFGRYAAHRRREHHE